MYETCINNDDNDYWCATSSNYDRDNEKAYCRKGLSSNVYTNICKSTKRTLKCPKGYTLNIISAKGSITSDESCDETKTVCSESLFNVIKALCVDKNSCDIFGNFLLTIACSNTLSNVVSIEFNCIPSKYDYKQLFLK